MSRTVSGMRMTSAMLLQGGGEEAAAGAGPMGASPWHRAQAHTLAASRALERSIGDVAAALRPLLHRGDEVATALVRSALEARLSQARIGAGLAGAWQRGLATAGRHDRVARGTPGDSVARRVREAAGEAFDALIRALPDALAEDADRVSRALADQEADQAAWARRLDEALRWWLEYAEPLGRRRSRDAETARVIAARIAGTDRLALIRESPRASGGKAVIERQFLTWVPPGPAETMVLHAAARHGGLRRHATRELVGCTPPVPRFPGRRTGSGTVGYE
ncbi:MAG: hypothetical protein H6744_12550 [Deltaproteobacteria bacterium]|nr:hypothetical protein [Deltaproteobacteria bacterium]MCB9787502.1 hypothetical protein [Deltaproteobacteria bacterium]